MSRLRRWGRGLAALPLLVVVQGCSNVQTPQLQGLKRDLDADTRQRVRVYDSCKARSQTPTDLDSCMTTEGYRFISAEDQDYRASQCWDDRYGGTLPKAYCYDKKPAGE